MRKIWVGLLCAALVGTCVGAEESAEETAEKARLLFDDDDGMFDVSNMLASSAGFLPVPIIITEPAVGFGVGAALLFFHDSMANREAQMEKAEAQGKKARLVPPSISGVVGFGTENGTWGAGAFHMGYWKEDHIRYLGAYFHASVNLDFYGRADSGLPALAYNLQSDIFLQQLLFRLAESDFFIGPEYLFANTDTELEDPMAGAPQSSDTIRDSALGVIALYDTRDNTFTPNSGTKTELKYSRHDEAIGGDNNYNKTHFKSYNWIPAHPKLVLGLRLDGQFTSGEVPFYMLPFIELRGIPAMRYQGAHTAVVETEVRWDFVKRWSAVGFVGSGWVADFEFNDFADSDAYVAGGVGFRYLIAKTFNMRAGVDIARGPEDTAVYLTVGSSWF
jgi:hypothetical protein